MRSVGSRTDVRVSMSRTDLLIGPPWRGQNNTLTPSFIHAVIARSLVGRTSKRILSHASGSTSLACGAEMGKQQDDPCYENIRNSESAKKLQASGHTCSVHNVEVNYFLGATKPRASGGVHSDFLIGMLGAKSLKLAGFRFSVSIFDWLVSSRSF